MLTPGMDAEYGKSQERCTVLAFDGRYAQVRFDDGREDWVFKKQLAWVPTESEIREGAARIRAENIANGQMRPDESRREGPRVIKGPGSFRKFTHGR